MDLRRIETIIHNYNHNNFELLDSDTETRFVYRALLEAEIVGVKQNGNLKKIKPNKVHVGTLQVKGRFGFVVGNDIDCYVHDIGNYLPNDTVIIVETVNPHGRNQEAQIIELVKREMKQVLIYVDNEKKVSVANNYQLREYTAQVARKIDLNEYMGTYLLANINSVRKLKMDVAIEEVVADRNDPDLQMKLVLHEFSIETEFDQETIDQAKALSDAPIQIDKTRKDLTQHLFMTIDGKDSKDLDDAICLISEGENKRLFVSIADVSHYVSEGSALDKSAFSRATSVYFVDRVVPMLPKSLSNGICSLHPDVMRLTQTCEMLISPSGHVLESSIYPSVIKSKYRMTYEDVNQMLVNKDGRLIKKYSEIYGILCEMNKLAKAINKKRLARGAFNLEDKEAKFTVDENGDITDINVRTRHDGERLIEEFMIIANETVASTIDHMQLPFVYRVHAQPVATKLNELSKLFKLFGIDLKGDFEQFHSSSFKQVLDSLEDPLDKRIVSDLIVRSLQKAVYSPNNNEHFGLASKAYTHFTSPIRRYPDLIVHRLLRRYLFECNYNGVEHLSGSLNLICDVASNKERSAIKAEQKIEDQKKAEYMRQFINDEFEGKIASITEFGFFVELDNSIRGLVRFKQLADFQKVINFTIKLRDGKKLKIGEPIKVRLVGVDTNRGLVDFEPIGLKIREVIRDEDNRNKQKGKTRLYNSKNAGSRNRTRGKRNKINTRRKSKSKR